MIIIPEIKSEIKNSLVISLGGSAIVPNNINVDFLGSFRQLALHYIEHGNRLIIVCGGGKVCRNYLEAAKAVSTVHNSDLDWVGIMATRLNAELVRSIFGDIAHEKVINDPTIEIDTDKKIIVAAGWKPGNSTDYVAVLLAKKFNAEQLLNISNIDYVCDKDPAKFPEAKKLENISWTEFRKIVGDEWKPGLNSPFDPIATKEAMKMNLTVKVLNMEISNLKLCLDGKPFKGTTIS